jgi:hypothetical protein
MADPFFLSFRGARTAREPGISIDNFWIPGLRLNGASRNDD